MIIRPEDTNRTKVLRFLALFLFAAVILAVAGYFVRPDFFKKGGGEPSMGILQHAEPVFTGRIRSASSDMIIVDGPASKTLTLGENADRRIESRRVFLAESTKIYALATVSNGADLFTSPKTSAASLSDLQPGVLVNVYVARRGPELFNPQDSPNTPEDVFSGAPPAITASIILIIP